jgi:hypothetical protein
MGMRRCCWRGWVVSNCGSGKLRMRVQHFEMAITLTKQKDVNVFNAVAQNNIEATQGDLQYAVEKLTAGDERQEFQ